MKISTLIKKLEKLKEMHGDVNVKIMGYEYTDFFNSRYGEIDVKKVEPRNKKTDPYIKIY